MVYLEEGERIENIPWQVGKEERNEGGKRKRLGREERSGRGNKKEGKEWQKKEKEREGTRAQKRAGCGEAPGTGQVVGPTRLVPPRP